MGVGRVWVDGWEGAHWVLVYGMDGMGIMWDVGWGLLDYGGEMEVVCIVENRNDIYVIYMNLVSSLMSVL